MPYKMMKVTAGDEHGEFDVFVIVEENAEFIDVMRGDTPTKCTCDEEADAEQILGLLNARLH